ncbi:D-Ala-D-Ala carboxypeptidase family metallohydrolase [Novosphingobium sp. JCM 18896]|uniref:D-Ala-D-Ala carboxypeptidase family metallohydrolase n=1 Tax=Novosphingobium sp. JCM 18896 TaxID=2989731 RepID=UPI0022237725|nr:D-Ala-D-Ala carboxypeptidase family metallohydrolase [Novosphingobium sp. JCM 18896]MCW1431406.1 D-Ala-D-Ala carboxypeptidase family metallohydrolase [Novosphingobium sp. JCM 18896]
MASNRVATLEIQMAADITRLQKDMKDAQRAIDAMTGGAEAGFNKSGRAASNMARAAQDAAAGMNKASGQGRMMAQQFSQMAQQVMAGGNAIQALAIQLPDIVSQLNASGQAANKFAAFMGGPWGIALTSAIALAASFGFEMLKGEESTKKNERAQRSFVDVLNDSKSSWEEVRKAAKAYNDEQAKTRVLTLDQIQTEALATAGKLKSAAASRTKYLAELEAAKLEADIAAQTGSGEGLMFALRKQAEVEAKIRENVAAISELERSASEITIKTAEAIAALRLDPSAKLKAGFDILRNQARSSITDVNELGNALTDLGRREEAAQKAITESTRKRADETMKLAKVTGEEIARALGTTITSGLRSASRNAGVGGAKNSYHLIGQAIDIPLTVNGRPITKEWIRQQLEPLGIQIKELLGPGDKGHSDHFHIAFGIKRLAPDQVRRLQDDAAEAAEKAAKAAREAATREWQALYDMQADMAAKLLPGLLQIEAVQRSIFSDQLARDNAERTKHITDAADATLRWNEQLERTLEYLDGLGGAGRTLSDIAAVITGLQVGDFRNVRGPLGSTLNLLNQTDFGKNFLGKFEGTLDKFFGGKGAFTEALGAFGLAVSANQLIGDIVGFKGGPLGIFTSLVESIFKKDKYGSSVVTASGVSLRGNNSDAKSGADSLGNALNTSLQNLAKMLNTTLDQYAVSIGVTNGKINVNPGTVNGKIGTTFQRDTIDFGKDEAGALKWAIQNAIEDGAFAGLSEGVKKFLTSGDVEQQIQRYMNLQSAFDELSSIKDPQGYALTQLDKAFTELRTTATEAGEDLARVEELYGLKRKEIVEKYAEDTLDLERQARSMDAEIARLQGDAIKATAIARELEREQIDETLRARYDLIASLQDEAQAAQEAAAASDRILALQIRLSRAQGDEATAKALENMQELNSAQTEQERQMLRMIHETDRLMEQQQQATEATSMFANMIQSVADAAYKASAELRTYANQIFDEATQTDPTVLLSQIQAAMKAGNAAVLPELIKAYLPMAENQAGSLADYQRQIAFLRQGSLNTANLADAQANQGASAMSWYLRQMQETGGRGSWMATMPDGFREEQERLGGITAEKLDRVIDLLERQNAIGADQVVELQTQTSTIDDAFNGGAGVVVLEPAA